MCSEEKFCCNFWCTSNTAAAKGFAVMHLIILGIAEFFMLYGIGSTGISNISWHMAFWPMLGFFTYWFILSILVVIGTHGYQRHGLLLVSTVLGWLGILGFAAYLFLTFRNYEYYIEKVLEFSLGCVWLLISFWYVLCIYGAMIEARETNTTSTRLMDLLEYIEMGQPGFEYNTVPSIPVQGQQVYPTPESSDSPPSYYELFPPMEQSSK